MLIRASVAVLAQAFEVPPHTRPHWQVFCCLDLAMTYFDAMA